MTNSEIVTVFDIIADLLEVGNENFFKVRAFRNSSHIIEGLERELTAIRSEYGAIKIKGLGEHSVAVINDLLDNGRSGYLEELKETIPLSILELMRVPTIGPKKAKLFYDKLGITDLEELEKAVRMHKLSALKGIGRKVEENIEKNLAAFKKGRDFFLISEAQPHALTVISEISNTPGFKKAEIAGSLRRCKEKIGDIDLLVAADDAEAVIDRFVNFSTVTEVLQRGTTKAAIKSALGIQIDLRVVPEEDFGAALVYFTGSKEHNVKIRDIAKRRGLKVNEYGVFNIETDQKIAGETEASVYEALDMQYVEPEMREDRGEIEMALTGTLPKLVTLTDIRGDLHIHSNWTDGVNTLEQMIIMAIDKGYSYINMSDHADKLKIAHGLSKERLLERLAEIEQLRKNYPAVKILHGIEANIDSDGSIDYDEDLLKSFDLVIASIHWGFSQSSEALTRRIVNACENPHVHMIGHLTGRLIGKREPYALDVRQIFDACKRTGTILELNAFPDRLDLKDDHLRIAKHEFGLKFAINTDAHSIYHFDHMAYGVNTARRAGLTSSDIINTLSADEMMASLKGN